MVTIKELFDACYTAAVLQGCRRLMHTMKVLTITLLACAVAVIRLAGAQTITLTFTVGFSSGRYRFQENDGDNLTVVVQSNMNEYLPVFGDVEVFVTVVALSGGDCTAGTDLMLPNNTTATLKFTRGSPSADLNITVPCDGIVERIDEQLCTLKFDKIEYINNGTTLTILAEPGEEAVVEIRDCEGEIILCKWELPEFSEPQIQAIEGINETVELFATCRGTFSSPFSIQVTCAPNSVPGFVREAKRGEDWSVDTAEAIRLSFSNKGTNVTQSDHPIVITIVDNKIAERRESLVCSILTGMVDSVQAEEPNLVTIVIIDNEVVEVSWAEELYCFNESVGNALTMLQTSSSFDDAIRLSALPREAMNNVTEEIFNSSTIFNGQPLESSIKFVVFNGIQFGVASVGTTGDITGTPEFTFPQSLDPILQFSNGSFTIVNDDIYEYDELVMADFEFDQGIQSEFNTSKGQPNVTYILIKDDDTVEVCFVEQNYIVNETDGVVAINLRVTGRYFVFINATVSCHSGSAITNNDFKFDETTVQFPMPFSPSSAPRTTEVALNIAIVDDQDIEERECFTCTIDTTSVPEKEHRCSLPSTTICIIDPVITCSFSRNVTVTEGSPAVLQIICDQAPGTDITLTVTTMDDTANSPSDYLGGTFNVTIQASSSMANLSVPTIENDTVENDEVFKATLYPPPGSDSVVIGIDTAYVTIIDASDVTCGFTQNASIHEGFPAELKVVCDRAPITNITLTVATMDNTANSPSDYSGGTFTVTIPARETMGSLSITTIKTDEVEDDEDFKATLSNPDGPDNVMVGIDTAYVTILDRTVLVRFNPATYTVTEEEDANALITLETIGAHSDVITVTVSARSGNATRDSDYQGAMFTVSLPSTNDNISTVNFNVPILDDSLVECPELLVLELEIPPAAEERCVRKVAPDVAQVLIYDNDVAQVSFSPQNYTVSEGTSVELIIVLDRPACQDISVTVTTIDETAVDGVDYDGKSSVVSFQPGETRKSCPIATISDTLFERNEYFKANLSHPLNGPVIFGTPTMAFVHITDDDVIPVRFNPDTYTVTEGVDANAVVYLEALQDHPRVGFNVTVHTQDESAADGEDYRGGQFSVFFPPGENNISFNVSIINDDVIEFDEHFALVLDIPEAAAALRVVRGSPDTATVNILDNDTVTISFSPQNYTVPEGSSVNLMIVADKVSPEDIEVTVTTMDITAESPDDYDGRALTCIIRRNESKTTCPPLRAHLNRPLEEDEHFKAVLSLQDTPDYAEVGPDPAFVTIIDKTVIVSFNRSEYVVKESSNGTTIVVHARGDITESSFEVPLIITGTARGERVDYYLQPSPPLMFPILANSVPFNLKPICDDTRNEGDENAMFQLTIREQDRNLVTIGNYSTTNVRIIDDCINILQTRIINDTVMADPLFTVPIDTRNTSDISEGTPLCYEIHGRNNTHLNLVSDDCTSVNAYTMEFLVEWQPGEIEAVNVIRVIGVVATDAANECHYIRVEVTDSGMCTAEVDGDSLDSAMLEKNNMTVYHKNNMVRIIAPNCENQRGRHLVMWVRCQKLRVTDISGDEYTMTKFIISRGLKHRALAHGLIGQFWGVPFTVLDREMDGENYTLTMFPPALPDQDAPRNRTFPAMLSDKTWSLDHKFAMPDSKCLYVGNSQGGPESSLVDSVIEGNWTDYITDSLYETDWSFSRYNAGTCP